MVRTLSALLLALSLAGCSDPVAATGACVALVNVNDVLYSPVEPPTVAAVSSDIYLSITRNTGCLDTGQQAEALSHGESNFLPVGTTLHQIEGFDPEERLAHWSSEFEEWQVLAPDPDF